MSNSNPAQAQAQASSPATSSQRSEASASDQPEHSREDDLLAGAIPIEEVEAQVKDAEDHDELSPHPASPDTSEPEELEPIEIEDEAETEEDKPEGASTRRNIHAFGPGLRHEDNWNRTPNTSGTGAIHVKTFVAKLRLDAIEHMDEQVNQWLDGHPQYEVKFVTKAVGTLRGKTDESALFLSVWV